MRNYNVVEIAKLLNVNKETVRRWIRTGDLKSIQTSKKHGNVINEENLYEFMKTKPKYRTMLDLSEFQIDNTYEEELNELLIDLIKERDRLNDRINKIQSLLEET